MLIHQEVSGGADRKEWAPDAPLSVIDKNQVQHRSLIWLLCIFVRIQVLHS